LCLVSAGADHRPDPISAILWRHNDEIGNDSGAQLSYTTPDIPFGPADGWMVAEGSQRHLELH